MGGKRVLGQKPRSIGDLSKSIADIDFSFLISHLVHVNGFSWVSSKELVVELLRYLMIKVCIGEVAEHGRLTAPSHAINTVWQVFLLFSAKYHEVCKRLVGDHDYYIHYHPLHGDKATLAARYASTCLAYKCTFGVEPNRTYWPPVESTSNLQPKKSFKLMPGSSKIKYVHHPPSKVSTPKEVPNEPSLYAKWCSSKKDHLAKYGFNLTVRLDGIEDVSIPVTPDMPSCLLYSAVSSKAGVPISKIKIAREGTQLSQDINLCDGGIKAGDSLEAVVV